MSVRGLSSVLAAVVVATGVAGCGSSSTTQPPAPAPLAAADLTATRAVTESSLDRRSVKQLRVRWQFRVGTAAAPVEAGGVVYVQTVKGVVALDRRTGSVRWRSPPAAGDHGAHGLVVSGPRVLGSTDTSVFALSAASGRPLWVRPLLTRTERVVASAPVVAHGFVYASTAGDRPRHDGALYALAISTGRVRWKFTVTKGSGGGARYPPSSDGRALYWGTTSPLPHGGTALQPNGGAYPGPALYTDSLVTLAPRTGKLLWYDQVTPHDVRGYDFQLSPVLARAGSTPAVFGAGRAGLVIAWDRATHRRLWQRQVGVHRNDRGRLPGEPVSVCPGLLGGAETPLAYSDGTLFVPVVDLCMQGGATRYELPDDANLLRRGRGELVALAAATGAPRWVHRFSQPVLGCATVANGVVFTSTLDGTIDALDTRNGTTLWHAKIRAGSRSCPALAARDLLVVAGGRLTAFSAG